MLSANFRYLSILDELQYITSISVSDRILHDSIKNSLESIGKSYSKVILHNMCSFYGLSENELLTNYDLFERSLYRILGKAAQALIGCVKVEMLRYAIMNGSEITATDILNPLLTVSYVLKNIHDREVFDFVRYVPSCELCCQITFFFTYKKYETQTSVCSLPSDLTHLCHVISMT